MRMLWFLYVISGPLGHKVEDFSDIVMNTLCLCVFVSVPVLRFPLFIEKIIFVEAFTLKTQRL